MTNLVGKNILIVDEVDDTRTTLEYAVRELQKDVETAAQKLGSNDRTQFSIFVLHVSGPKKIAELRSAYQMTVSDESHKQNKDKPKKGHLPQDMMDDGRYLAARTVSDVWICYPWEATYASSVQNTPPEKISWTNSIFSDIDEHDKLARSQSGY